MEIDVIEIIKNIIKDPEDFGKYLKFISNNYYFSYINQLSLFEQNPDIKQLAGFEIWSETFGVKVNDAAYLYKVLVPVKNVIHDRIYNLNKNGDILLEEDGRQSIKSEAVLDIDYKELYLIDVADTDYRDTFDRDYISNLESKIKELSGLVTIVSKNTEKVFKYDLNIKDKEIIISEMVKKNERDFYILEAFIKYKLNDYLKDYDGPIDILKKLLSYVIALRFEYKIPRIYNNLKPYITILRDFKDNVLEDLFKYLQVYSNLIIQQLSEEFFTFDEVNFINQFLENDLTQSEFIETMTRLITYIDNDDSLISFKIECFIDKIASLKSDVFNFLKKQRLRKNVVSYPLFRLKSLEEDLEFEE